MALIDRMKRGFRKKKAQQENEINSAAEEELKELEQELTSEKQNFVRKKIKQKDMQIEDCCDQLIESTKSLDQKKLEYEQITAYLTDIQLIDQMTEEEKESVQAVAFKLADLNTDRESLREENRALTSMQFRFMQLHEYEVEEGISHLVEQEKYQHDINGDLQKLEEEKMNLVYEERYYLEKLHNLKMLALTSIFLCIIIAGVMGMLFIQYEFDILFGLMLLFVAQAIVATLIFVKYRNVNYALAYCRKQQKRAVQLINKVKIKWVNNTATLDYLCAKYNVGSSRELEYMWEQYRNALENEEKYKRASKELTHYSSLLTKVLQKIGVHDPDIWLTQPEALLDPREMVEVTHNLNVRRGQLREDMAFDEDMIDISISNIKEFIEKHPEAAIKVRQVLEPFRIRL